MALLEKSDNNNEVKLPLERLFQNNPTAKVLDFFLENHSLACAKNKLFKIIAIPEGELGQILDSLVEEKILKAEKIGLEHKYSLYAQAPRTEGLFQYFRATLDNNLDRYEFGKS